MKQSIMWAAVLVIGLLGSSACSSTASVPSKQSNAAQANSTATGELRYKAADGWVKEQTTSSMRVAQYKLPKTEGDPEDALLVLYFFGATQGGAVQANIDRWISQMQQPDGSASQDRNQYGQWFEDNERRCLRHLYGRDGARHSGSAK